MTHAFTRNYRDHSNETGFQFEFQCDKCSNGYRSSYRTNKVGLMAEVVKAASAFFGQGYRYGRGADHIKDALRGPAWDSAFKEAIEEIRPKFKQCTRCGLLVCPEVCWNDKRQLCETCAPDLQEEAGSIQSKIAIEQAEVAARKHDQMEGVDMSTHQQAACPQCQARLGPNARFCAGCGYKIAPANTFCSQCGAAQQHGSRFCAGCGSPAGGP